MNNNQSEKGRGAHPEGADLIRMLHMLSRTRKALNFPEQLKKKHINEMIKTTQLSRGKFVKLQDEDNIRIIDLLIAYLQLRKEEK